MTEHPNPSQNTMFWVRVGWFSAIGLLYLALNRCGAGLF